MLTRPLRIHKSVVYVGSMENIKRLEQNLKRAQTRALVHPHERNLRTLAKAEEKLAQAKAAEVKV